MADNQTQIQIPERRDDEPPASAAQLQRIRQFTTGLSLQGYRFDYRKLGNTQADTILQQLLAMNDQQSTPTKPAKQGPGCIASLAKGTTALIFWTLVLAGVAGGAYLIYWQMNQTPQTTDSTNPTTPGDSASSDSPNTPGNPGKTRKSTIFDGLGVSDNNTATDPKPTTPKPGPETDAPTPQPVTPPVPTIDRDLAQQLKDLEKMLVSLSQYTRNDFAADLRAQSAQGMTNRLDAFSKALSALQSIDPTIPPRIRAAIDAFAAPDLDGSALRDEIKRIRNALPDQN